MLLYNKNSDIGLQTTQHRSTQVLQAWNGKEQKKQMKQVCPSSATYISLNRTRATI